MITICFVNKLLSTSDVVPFFLSFLTKMVKWRVSRRCVKDKISAQLNTKKIF